jgi:hypothetical protein
MQVTKLSTRDNIVHLATFSATAASFFFRGAILWNGQPLSGTWRFNSFGGEPFS